MPHHGRKIRRNHNQPFFRHRNNYARLYFAVFMILAIVAVPILAFWQQDALQLAALEAFDMAPTATPFASERANIGEEFFQQGDVETAAAYFELAVQQQPDNIGYLYEYGLMLIELDRNDEAEQFANRIIERNPQDPRGYALKANAIVWQDPAAAIPIALEGTEYEGEQRFAALHSALAVGYTLIERYDEALREGDLSVRISPMDANAHRSYSYPLIFTGNYSGAISQLESAISINPNLTAPYFELASLYRNQAINRPEVAVAIYNEVLQIEPNNERAYARLCQTYAAIGEFEDAEDYCDEAIYIDPDYALAHRVRGQLRYSRRNYEGSLEEFETCIQLSTGASSSEAVDWTTQDISEIDIECLYIRGLAHYFLAQCDLAWDYLSRSLQHPGAYSNVLEQILRGMTNVTINCVGYQNRNLPTPIPPTAIPPTPIGGF